MKVKAINRVYKKGKQIGWKMMDEQGNVMDATSESIKQAILNRSVMVLNLVVTSSGELKLIDTDRQIIKNTNAKYI